MNNAAPAHDALIDFLDGSAPLDGVWFGNAPAGTPPFWWRKYLPDLRRALASTGDPQ